MSITTPRGTTVSLHESDGRTYVLRVNEKDNLPHISSVLIGEIIDVADIGLAFQQARTQRSLLGPDVLRAIAELIEQEQ